MDMLKVFKVVAWVLGLFFVLFCTASQIKSWVYPSHDPTIHNLQERIAHRDSLVMLHLQEVQVRMDSIQNRNKRIESLLVRIPEMESAIQLNLRTTEQLSPQERTELRHEIIEFLNRQP